MESSVLFTSVYFCQEFKEMISIEMFLTLQKEKRG